MTDTVPAPELATYALLPSGLNATATGVDPTVIVLDRASVLVFITLTEFEDPLQTYALVWSGDMAIEFGELPTVIAAPAVLSEVSIGVTVPEP